MNQTIIIITVLTGLFMGWLLTLIWRDVELGALVQFSASLIGAGAGVGLFKLATSVPLGWLSAVLLGTLGSVAASVLVSVTLLIIRNRKNLPRFFLTRQSQST